MTLEDGNLLPPDLDRRTGSPGRVPDRDRIDVEHALRAAVIDGRDRFSGVVLLLRSRTVRWSLSGIGEGIPPSPSVRPRLNETPRIQQVVADRFGYAVLG